MAERGKQDDSQYANGKLSEAFESMRLGDWEAVVSACTLGIERDASLLDLYRQRAEAYRLLDMQDAAQLDYRTLAKATDRHSTTNNPGHRKISSSVRIDSDIPSDSEENDTDSGFSLEPAVYSAVMTALISAAFVAFDDADSSPRILAGIGFGITLGLIVGAGVLIYGRWFKK